MLFLRDHPLFVAKPSHSSLTTVCVKDFETTWQALWWLGEFALAFLFEPLDWLITIRDIGSGLYHGDLSLWDFLGFLPIITNNLGRIARLMSRSDVDELVEAGIRNSDALQRTNSTPNSRGGDPFAFGYGTRQSRAENLVSEAAPVAGIHELSSYVDEIIYATRTNHLYYEPDPYFRVINGKRILIVNDQLFRRSAAGQFIIVSHELVHAQQVEFYARTMFGGNADTAFSHLAAGGRRFATMEERLLYATNEVIAESLGLIRGELYFGQLTYQQMRDHLGYIRYYTNKVSQYSL